MDGQIAQFIPSPRHTQCRRHLGWSPRSVRSFFLRRSLSPAAAMSSASEREPCGPDVAATAAVAPPTSASSSTVSGDDERPMTPRAAAPPSAGTTPSQSLNAGIDRFKLEQHRLTTSKKQIVKELRNAERKRRRLRARAAAHGGGVALGRADAERKETGSDGRSCLRERRHQSGSLRGSPQPQRLNGVPSSTRSSAAHRAPVSSNSARGPSCSTAGLGLYSDDWPCPRGCRERAVYRFIGSWA